MKTTIYKVYDDEWSEIMGEGQLKEFAIYQIVMNYDSDVDEELIDAVETYISEDKQAKVKEILDNLCNEGNKISDEDFAKTITIEQAKDLLKLRYFDVDEIEVY